MTTDLVPLDTKKPTQEEINARNVATGVNRAMTIVSVFEDKMPAIQALLDGSEQDGAISAIQKAMLATVLSIIPIAEKQYKDKANQRGSENLIYALSNTLQSATQIINDLQANQDRSLVGSRISTHVLNPAFLLMAQQMIDKCYRLRVRLVEAKILDPNDTKAFNAILNEVFIKPMAEYMEATYNDTASKITQMVVT